MPIFKEGGAGGRGTTGFIPGEGAAAGKLYGSLPELLRRAGGRRCVESERDSMLGKIPVTFPCRLTVICLLYSAPWLRKLKYSVLLSAHRQAMRETERVVMVCMEH